MVFVISFLTLGYVGTRPPEGIYKTLAQVCTVLYFAFFFFMPWYTTYDKNKPEPERVT
jgi:ubiquinol-cytochrome c reductase cytochrome b subunit